VALLTKSNLIDDLHKQIPKEKFFAIAFRLYSGNAYAKGADCADTGAGY